MIPVGLKLFITDKHEEIKEQNHNHDQINTTTNSSPVIPQAEDGHSHGGLIEMPVFRVMKTFTGGLLLSVALIHLLPDSLNDLSDPELVAKTQGYPIAQASVVCGCLFVIGLQLLGKFINDWFDQRRRQRRSHHSHSHSKDEGIELENALHVHGESCPHEHLSTSVSTVLRLVVFELSIAIHSLAIGFGLGSTTNIGTIQALMIAMVFHQIFEGVCLGLLFMEVELSVWLQALLRLIFSLSLAVGIVLGIVATDSITSSRVSGIANAFAAGCLVYGALVNIIGEEFSKIVSNEPANLKPLMYAGVVTGCGFMALLAIWA